jgi:hypothetical protein
MIIRNRMRVSAYTVPFCVSGVNLRRNIIVIWGRVIEKARTVYQFWRVRIIYNFEISNSAVIFMCTYKQR